MSAVRALGRYWFTPAPPQRLALLRILIGAYGLALVVVRGQDLLRITSMGVRFFEPVGVVTLLSDPMSQLWLRVLMLLLLGANIAFVFGWRFRVTGPVYAAALLWLLSYANSWGQILHTDNLLCMYVIVLALTPSADSLSMDARGGSRNRVTPPAAAPCYGWGIRLMCVIAVTTYMTAGLAKLRNSGLAFASGDTLRWHVAFDNLRKLELGSFASPLAEWILPHPNLFVVLGLATLVMELGAPLALVHRRIALVWASVMWLFHVGVVALMAIVFAFPLTGLAFAPFFRIERLLDRRGRPAEPRVTPASPQ